MACSAFFKVEVIPASDWSSVNAWAFWPKLAASLACFACCAVMFEPDAGVALAAPPMIVFSVWLMALQAAVPVAGPVVLAADPAGLADGLAAALVSCAPPLLLQPATAAAAIATAPMASFFLITCSPSGPARLPVSRSRGLPVADPSRLSTISDECLAFCAHLHRLASAARESGQHRLKQMRTG
jgi:hypothetical protein